MQQQENSFQNRIRINYQIRVPQVRLILDDGTSPGVLPTREALQMANSLGLDLVEINPKAFPPVCKILDYGKFKYEEKKKLISAKKAQKQSEIKELSFRPNTGDHDLNHKLESAKQFLQDGNKVKFSVKFRGREITHPQIAKEKLEMIIKELSTLISNIPPISLDGKIMSMIIVPK